MPSGRTHDRITLWSLPLVAALTFGMTQRPDWTLIAAGGYLFGGLMFGPDLDIHSVQYKRWGWLRWIWLPYRASMSHRSVLSHGPILGTMLRVIYLTIWLGLFAMIAIGLANGLGMTAITQASAGDAIEQWLRQYPREGIALLVGIELGAMSHSISDWTGSTHKRLRKQGWSALKPRAKSQSRSRRRQKQSRQKR